MRTLERIALALIIVGAINWGLIGFFNFDLVAAIFGGQNSLFSRIIYSLVGLSGIVCLGLLFKDWGEEDTMDTSTGRNYENVNYGTEFGKETDVSDFKKSKTDDEKKY